MEVNGAICSAINEMPLLKWNDIHLLSYLK